MRRDSATWQKHGYLHEQFAVCQPDEVTAFYEAASMRLRRDQPSFFAIDDILPATADAQCLERHARYLRAMFHVLQPQPAPWELPPDSGTVTR